MSPVTIINYLIKSCPTLEAHFYRTVYLKKRKCNKIEVLRRLNVRSHLFRNQYFCVLPLRCFKVIQHMNNVTITPLKSSNMRIVENIIFVKVVLVKTYTKSILFTFSTNFRTNNQNEPVQSCICMLDARCVPGTNSFKTKTMNLFYVATKFKCTRECFVFL